MNSELPISRKAFSLLELLISITLLALVSTLIYGAFFPGFQLLPESKGILVAVSGTETFDENGAG